ncbi:MAG: alpha/beta fold hydrolase, partial [Candidatus Sulfotelmatobacter sp.]
TGPSTFLSVSRFKNGNLAMPRSPWLVWPQPRSAARFQLVCIPYAGGSAYIFNDWPKHLPESVQVCAIQLPGRARRIKEPAFTQLSAIVPPLTKALLPHLGSRFALFGHSMGALISFEVIRELRRVHRLKALHLFVSGCYAPHIPDPNPLYPLPDHQFIEELKRLQGVPPAELDNSELVQLMLPTLRADCLVTETYSHQEDLPLDCPITVFGGTEDTIAKEDDLAEWQKHTNSRFSKHIFPGKHFFFDTAEAEILQIVSRDIGRAFISSATI